MDIPPVERVFVDAIASAQQGGSNVSVESVAANHGRGLVSKQDVQVGDTVARQKWPIAFCQDVPNSWRCQACAVCGKFTGTLSSQLKLLATATADADTWSQVAATFPEAGPLIVAAQKAADTAMAESEFQEAAEQPGTTATSHTDDDCEDDDLTEVCFLENLAKPEATAATDRLDLPIIPESIMDIDSQTLTTKRIDEWGTHVCSDECFSEALFRCIPLLSGEGQPAFAELLRQATADASAPLQKAVASLDPRPSPEAVTTSIDMAVETERLLLDADPAEHGPGVQDIAEMLHQHCTERSESMALGAKIYAWLLGRYISAPAGVTLPILIRHLTLLCATPWWDAVAARNATPADDDDHESPAALKQTVLEGAVLLRALLQPRFETAIKLRTELGLEIELQDANVKAANMGGTCAPLTAETPIVCCAAAGEEAECCIDGSCKPAEVVKASDCSEAEADCGASVCQGSSCGGKDPPCCEPSVASGSGVLSPIAADDRSAQWTERAAARGWGDVALQLAEAETWGAAPAKTAGDIEQDWTETPSCRALPILFSSAMLSLVLGALDMNTVGVSICSPVAEALRSLGEVAASDDTVAVEPAAASSAATSAAFSATSGVRSAQECVHKVTSALLAACAARRIEGSDEPDPQEVAEAASQAVTLTAAPASGTEAAVSISGSDEDQAAAVWRSALVESLCPPVRGTALFSLVAMTNHSDEPDAEFCYPEATVSVRLLALRPITAGQEVCMSYCEETLTGADRSAALRHYGFDKTEVISDASAVAATVSVI